MNGVLLRVGAADVARLMKDEEYLEALLDGGQGEALGAAIGQLPWYFRWLLKLARKNSSIEKAGARREVLHLNKGWQGLHWLLCGAPWEAPAPLGNAILGGDEVGEDLGYGPARVVNPKQVQEVAKALALLSAAQVMKRYDGEAMDAAEIYPGGFAADDSWREELEEDFERLKGFYRDAAKDGDAVLSWLE